MPKHPAHRAPISKSARYRAELIAIVPGGHDPPLMPSPWTISAPGFPAQTFAALNLSAPVITKHAQELDTATFKSTGAALDSAFLWPWGTICTILKNNAPWFTGRLTKPAPGGSGSAGESIEYELSGPWWDLEQCVYMQNSNFYNGNAGNPAAQASMTPMLLIGYELIPNGDGNTFTKLTTGQQITNILLYAISCGANFQIGAIDPGIYFPTSEEKATPCSRLIQAILRWVPDQVLSFDYSTTPPTVNLARRANARAVVLAIPGPPVDTVRLTPRSDLVVPAVCLYYLATNQVNGSSWVSQTKDIWPLLASPKQLRALVAPLQLSGSRVNSQRAPVVTKPIPQPSDTGDTGTDTASAQSVIGWLQARCPELLPLTTANLSIVPDTYYQDLPDGQVDLNGNAIDLEASDLPRELIKGNIPPWLVKPAPAGGGGSTVASDGFVHAANVYIGMQLKYDFSALSLPSQQAEYDNARKLFDPNLSTSNDGWFYTILKATDALTETYQKPISESTAEAAPAGMAQYLYTALNQLHQDGEIILKEQECGGAAQVGNAVNLSGGRAEWAGMNAQVQRIVEELETGKTTITVGPPKHLSPEDLLQLLRSWRTITSSERLEERQTGNTNTTTGTNDGIGETPGTATTHSSPPNTPVTDFQLSDAGGGHLGVNNGLVNGQLVSGMTSGGDPAYTITPSSGDTLAWIEADVTLDGNGNPTSLTLSINTGTVQPADSPATNGGSGTYYLSLGDFTMTGSGSSAVISIGSGAAGIGSQTLALVRTWSANPISYEAVWTRA
jgi:hypothetical protein